MRAASPNESPSVPPAMQRNEANLDGGKFARLLRSRSTVFLCGGAVYQSLINTLRVAFFHRMSLGTFA